MELKKSWGAFGFKRAIGFLCMLPLLYSGFCGVILPGSIEMTLKDLLIVLISGNLVGHYVDREKTPPQEHNHP